MTAPSITLPPHVRGRGVSMTQSKSYSHGRIYIGLFHSSTSLSSSPSFLCSLRRLFDLADASFLFPLSHSLSFTFTFFRLDNRNVQSFFSGARNYIWSDLVQYCCPLASADNQDVCLKKYMALVLIFNYSLSACLRCVSPLHWNYFHFSKSTLWVVTTVSCSEATETVNHKINII